MEFWRGPAYTAFFEYLDQQGGFYYEVRSLSDPTRRVYLFLTLFNPHSAGAMRLYTLSQLPSLRHATRSNSLTILGTNIIRIPIAPKTRMCGRKAGVRVILRGVSVGLGFFFSDEGGDADGLFI